jgi:hypothetical protein
MAHVLAASPGGTGVVGAVPAAAALLWPPGPWHLGADAVVVPPSPTTYAVLVLGTFLGSTVMVREGGWAKGALDQWQLGSWLDKVARWARVTCFSRT